MGRVDQIPERRRSLIGHHACNLCNVEVFGVVVIEGCPTTRVVPQIRRGVARKKSNLSETRWHEMGTDEPAMRTVSTSLEVPDALRPLAACFPAHAGSSNNRSSAATSSFDGSCSQQT